MTNKPNLWIRVAFMQLREKRGNKCELCEFPLIFNGVGYGTKQPNLQFAHVNPTGLSGRGRGRKERYYDILNHPNDYLLLCKDCHNVVDSN